MNTTKPLTIRLTSCQRKDLEKRTQENGFGSINSYILSLIFPNTIVKNYRHLTHQEILNRLKQYESGSLFDIPSLFTESEWQSFDNTISIGRTFRMASKKSGSNIANAVDFVEKRSGYAAVYRVKQQKYKKLEGFFNEENLIDDKFYFSDEDFSDKFRMSDPIFKSIGYPSKIYYKSIQKYIKSYTKKRWSSFRQLCWEWVYRA